MLNITQLLNPNGHRGRISRRPVVVWNLTKSCNLNCSFCYYDAARGSSASGIDWNLARRIVEQTKQAQIKFVLLSGGEPLLYPNILDLIEAFTSNSIRVGISTNGTLIDRNFAIKLKKTGLDYAGISLDGLEGLHNTLRNSSTAFSRALAGLKNIQDAGIKSGIRLILNSYNYTQLKDFFAFVEGLRPSRLCFYHLVFAGRATSGDNDLSKIQRRTATELIIRLTADWIKRKIHTQVLTVDNFSDALLILGYVKKISPKNYERVLRLLRAQAGCPAGKRILAINHRGYVYPCQFWQSHKMADLKKENLVDILNDAAMFSRWKTRLKGQCRSCNYKDICGGCRVRAYQKFGDFWQEDPSCEADILERN